MKNVMLLLSILLLNSWINPITDARTITGTVYSSADGSKLAKVTLTVKNTSIQTTTDTEGHYEIQVPADRNTLLFNASGYEPKEVLINGRTWIDVYLDPFPVEEIMDDLVRKSDSKESFRKGAPAAMEMSLSHSGRYQGTAQAGYDHQLAPYNTEEYDGIEENIFHHPLQKPLSTFSIDVDAASYSNVRRFIQSSQLPPKDAVRIEELINYFSYDYPQPGDENPFSISLESGVCPWNTEHQLVHIGLQGRNIPTEDLPPTNLVFLIDVSGSMNQPNKLPLLKSAFKLLVSKLRPEDRVSIVVYAGAAGLVLPPTSGDQKAVITAALDQLQAGGSTAGGQGIRLAYSTARQHFMERGNNRVILATDGDFNVGESSNAAMERLIEEEKKSGVFLTVLGFGMGNYKDSKMEILADKGNGNYAYIDNVLEARKVFVNEFGGTLFTIAKDVKIQVEFNPAIVQAYRLIGYENRALRDEDFNDDKKDAGDLGSGHTVTALYEIIPVGVSDKYTGSVDPLKYQDPAKVNSASKGKEIMTVKLRYKMPDANTSRLLSAVLEKDGTSAEEPSNDFRFSAAVAGYGMVLRDSEYRGMLDFGKVLELARGSIGTDKEGYRAEFIRLVESTMLISNL